MAEVGSAIPLACVPGAIPAAERPQHFALLRHLFDTQAQERVDRADGYAWRFPAQAFDDVAALVSLERKCCPFLRFHIEVLPDDASVWLTIDGPAGTRPFLEAELAVAGTEGSSR